MPVDWIVSELNATVRGWVGYFHVRNCSRTLGPGAMASGGADAHASAKAAQDPRSEDGIYPVYRQRSVRQVRALQSADDSGLDEGACLAVKNIGKPCAGKPHARFDEGGLILCQFCLSE